MLCAALPCVVGLASCRWADGAACLPPPPSHPQLLPGGLSSDRLLELRVLEATCDAGDATLALLRRCPALHSIMLAPRGQACGAGHALALRGQALAGLAGLPSLRSLGLHVDRVGAGGEGRQV